MLQWRFLEVFACSQVTNLMNAGRVKDIAMDRRATGKAGTQVQRAALGNISNKSSILSKSDTGKVTITISIFLKLCLG